MDTATGEVLDDAGEARLPFARESVIAASILGSAGIADEEVPF